ncbi:MAG TPA: SDR family oxidoreductase [Candidatus Acidoferrales bacterium]|jgi:3-oxoacyl-[acyl-carrier protein] reductase|nr:SDR family oxidoreductase [Candidatus Acidoferrales bacterium]
MMVDLKDKLAVVSGGARDIGAAVSIELARRGAAIAFCFHESDTQARKTEQQIREAGPQVFSVKVDVMKAGEVNAFIAKVQEKFQRPIDILVNVVGGLCARKTIAEMDEDFWDLVIDRNLKTTFLMTKSALPHMSDGGAIINFSSQAARDGGGPGAIPYATSKGAIVSFTRGLAKELGPRGIRVNAVCPGMTNTTFHDTFTKPEVRQRVAAATPLGREGQAAEVAALVAYLASSGSSFINGAAIDINGGILFS